MVSWDMVKAAGFETLYVRAGELITFTFCKCDSKSMEV